MYIHAYTHKRHKNQLTRNVQIHINYYGEGEMQSRLNECTGWIIHHTCIQLMLSTKNSIISVTVVELTALHNVAYHLLAAILQTLIVCHGGFTDRSGGGRTEMWLLQRHILSSVLWFSWIIDSIFSKHHLTQIILSVKQCVLFLLN